MRHTTIFREPGRFGGWPANYGMWCWDDEIVVGFTVGAHKTIARGHAIDKSQPVINRQARSLDRGETWQVEEFNGERPDERGLSADEHMAPGRRLSEVMDLETALVPSTPLRFQHPGFALMAARTGLARGVFSFFYVSYDRCRSWGGPYRLPIFGQTGIAARTDYIVQGRHSALFFLTANKADGAEGKVICVGTEDGGMTFELLAEVGGEPPGAGDFAIMPASLQLPSSRILCARRCRDGASGLSWIDLYASDDSGRSWRFLNRPVEFHQRGHSGNPPCLKQLSDGRVLLIYGDRDGPYNICARVSIDEGATFSDEIILRSGGANGDIGYVRAVVLDDDSVIAAYYINDRPDGDGERFIEATIWQP
ncbi:MAG: sialidase family protein [Chloroflexota bacterium]|nr:sialidase family protein [Chloroflexota bacterium]